MLNRDNSNQSLYMPICEEINYLLLKLFKALLSCWAIVNMVSLNIYYSYLNIFNIIFLWIFQLVSSAHLFSSLICCSSS
jgi:hypothetical protein